MTARAQARVQPQLADETQLMTSVIEASHGGFDIDDRTVVELMDETQLAAPAYAARTIAMPVVVAPAAAAPAMPARPGVLSTPVAAQISAPIAAPIAAPVAAPVPAMPVPAAPVEAMAQGSGPLSLGLTPPMEREVFQLARRVALQADLPAAMRVLRHGVARLTDSADAMCIFFDAALCSAWIAEGDAARELDGHAQALVADVAGRGQRAMFERAVFEPVGEAPVRAVLMVRRTQGSPSYTTLEIATVAAIANAVVGLVGHFAAEHAAGREQAQRDARTPFRREALIERRANQAAPGKLVTTPRTWIRWAYPTLIGLVAAVLLAAVLIQVPTYSTGMSIITAPGEQITSPMPGTVLEVRVSPGMQVKPGQPLLRLRSPNEDNELEVATNDYRNALAAFMTTPDDSSRNALVGIASRRNAARKAVEDHMLRATTAGIVGDVRVRAGQLVTPGAALMKVSPTADLTVVGLFPGPDRPRLELGMTMQIELPGYHKKREEAVIDEIGTQVIGPEEARKSLGDPIGDALPIAGPVVLVRAHLTSRTFEANGREYTFHDGMVGKAEVRTDESSLIRALLPGKGE